MYLCTLHFMHCHSHGDGAWQCYMYYQSVYSYSYICAGAGLGVVSLSGRSALRQIPRRAKNNTPGFIVPHTHGTPAVLVPTCAVGAILILSTIHAPEPLRLDVNGRVRSDVRLGISERTNSVQDSYGGVPFSIYSTSTICIRT